jgi:hypothetical protein
MSRSRANASASPPDEAVVEMAAEMAAEMAVEMAAEMAAEPVAGTTRSTASGARSRWSSWRPFRSASGRQVRPPVRVRRDQFSDTGLALPARPSLTCIEILEIDGGQRVRMFSRWIAYISTVMVAATAALAISSPAQADSGDGVIDCNSGEICLAESGSINYIKHFWWGAWHDTYKWWDVSASASSNTYVIHTMSYFANKDTDCSITFYDDYGTGVSFGNGDGNYQSWYVQFAEAVYWYPPLLPIAAANAAAWDNANRNHTRC